MHSKKIYHNIVETNKLLKQTNRQKMETTVKLNNTKATQKSKESFNHNWEGDSYNTEWCRKKCIKLIEQGKEAFYKKTGDKYTVYSFR